MDERELLIEELTDGHRMVGAALSDLSSEVAEWQPGGTANSIASLLAHTIVGEDEVVNQMLKGWGVAVRKRRLGGEDRHPG